MLPALKCFDDLGDGAIFVILVATTDIKLKNTVTGIAYRFSSTVTVKFAETNKDALDCFKRTNVSMCIVDSDIEGNRGMLLARHIREIKRYLFVPIIYVSGKMDELITAFKTVHCYDFFLKPVSADNIYSVVKLFSNEFCKSVSSDEVRKPSVLLGLSQGMLKVYVDEILMIEARHRKCVVHTCSGEHELTQSLNSFYEKVEQYGLLRAHRSYIINPTNVKQIDKSSDVWIIRFFESDKISPLSKIYKPDVIQRLSFLL